MALSGDVKWQAAGRNSYIVKEKVGFLCSTKQSRSQMPPRMSGRAFESSHSTIGYICAYVSERIRVSVNLGDGLGAQREDEVRQEKMICTQTAS